MKCWYVVLVLIVVCSIYISEARGQTGNVSIVEAGSVWKYLDNGSNQGTAWRGTSFNDSAWASGSAKLGYGDGDEMTVVSYGPSPGNKYITTYFRHSFNVTDVSRFTSLTLRLKRDDGAVVYVNGTEVWRPDMPTGTITHTTRASAATEASAFLETTISPNTLVNGTNVIAIEIHQIDTGSSDIGFDFQLLGFDPAVPAAVTRGPYLQQGTPTSMIVRWRTDVATDSRVRYGAIPGSLNSVASDSPLTTEHEVRLTGLSPEATYYYSVGTTTITLAGDNSSHFFTTSPSTGTARPTRVWVLGDSGTSGSGARSVRTSYLKLAGTSHTNLWLMLGDNAYNTGLDSEYQTGVFDMYPMLLRKSVLWPTIGNHDTAGSPNPPPGLPYHNIFSLPTSGEAGGLASGTENYYSFDYGNIHFICLDAMTSNRSASGPMATWLQNDLASNLQPWIIAFWHHPPYSKGSHNSDIEEELVEMRQNVLPILEAGGVDLVLAGHSHSYERSYLIDGHYGSSNTFTNAMKKNGGDGNLAGNGAYIKSSTVGFPHAGAVYIVSGVGGQTAGGLLNHPAMFKSTTTLGSIVLDIDGTRLDVRFLKSDGVVFDSFTIIKGSIQAPADPTGLTATAATSSQINLAWIDNSNNEDGFKIEQSTDGVTFTLAATTSANATTNSLTNLSPATTYHFRVRAFNSSGDSANSNTASATTLQSPPAAPTSLTATAISSSQINLSWADNSNNEDGFKIEQSTDDVTFTLAATTGANEATRSMTGLSPLTTYRFRVRAYNSGGDSTNSNTAMATTLQPPPAAPTSLTAASISYHQINLAWVDNSNNETGFRVEQSTDGGATFTLAATTSANATTRSITGLTPLTTYHFRVRAFNGGGDSAYTNTASATTTAETAPTSPSGLTGTGVSASEVSLSWQDKSNNELGFEIERCLGAGCVSLTQIAQVGPNITTFIDAELSTNTTYRYRVRAYNNIGNSSYSNSVEPKTMEAEGAVLVRQGSVWKYLDNGSNQGTAWRDTSFDDSAWASGPAKLGYGDNDEATIVSYGPSPGNKYITTYFRQTFNIADVSLYTGLTLQLKRDDGAIVYLNGVEVWRVDMPAGNVTYTTPASAATDAQGFLETTISPSNLVNGTNVIAVEIHQIDHGSSDIALDLQLLGSGSLIGMLPMNTFETIALDPLFATSPATKKLWFLRGRQK